MEHEREDGKIVAECWLKNNTEWYYPRKNVDLSVYDNGYKYETAGTKCETISADHK